VNPSPGEQRKCKIFVIGVGSPLRRDDAAALYLVEELRRRGYSCVLECPMGVELCAHRIREISPELLIIVDAALGVEAGNVTIINEPPSQSLWTTHNIDPGLMHRYVSLYAGKVVYLLLGVKDVGIGEGLSMEARRAIQKALKLLEEINAA